MSIHLNISHYRKPKELGTIVALCNETNLQINQRILEAVRQLAAIAQALGYPSSHEEESQ